MNEEQVGDYYTLNVSCPNAFGGESFAEPRTLGPLLSALGEVPCRRPVYVKMPLDLPWEQFVALLGVPRRPLGAAVRRSLDGAHRPDPPLWQALHHHRRGRRDVTRGGAGKARRRADLLQLITGLIFEGPSLVSGICQTLGGAQPGAMPVG